MNIPEIVIKKVYQYMMNNKVYMVVRNYLTYDKYNDKGCRYDHSGYYDVMEIFVEKMDAEKYFESVNEEYTERKNEERRRRKRFMK